MSKSSTGDVSSGLGGSGTDRLEPTEPPILAPLGADDQRTLDMPRRTSAAFFLGDTAFLSDPKFRALLRRLPDPDDFNSAVGAYWVALASARRNGRPELDVRRETDSRFIDDLEAVGLLVETGFRQGPFDEWRPMTPQQVEAGKARAAAAKRTEAGTFLPSETSALDTLDQRVQPSTLLTSDHPQVSTPEGESAREGGDPWADPEGEALTWLIKRGCEVRPGNGFHRKLVTTVEVHGINAVIGMLDRLERAGVKHGDTKGYVFGVADGLNGHVDLGAIEAEERATEREKARANRQVLTPLQQEMKAAMLARYGAEEVGGPA